MYTDNYGFKEGMKKLFDKLEEVSKNVKSLQTNPEVMPIVHCFKLQSK